MPGITPQELGERGWEKSGDRWIALVSEALERRGITAHMKYIDIIIRKTFENNKYIGGNIGWSTIDSYVGYLQATDQLGTPIKSHDIKYHRNRLNWAPRGGGQRKPFDPNYVFGGVRPSSTTGTRVIRSRW